MIAANVASTRQLEGMLLRLHGEQAARNEPLTEELVKALLGKINGEVKGGGQRPLPRQIINRVAEYFQIRPSDIKGTRRIKALVLARQITMYLLRKELQLPFTEIGECLGGRDHTTIMHGDNKIAGGLAESERLRLDVTNIRKAIYQQGVDK